MADEGQEKEKLQRKKGANLMKNLFKKIGALLVAAIMVLSMCTAVFADGNANVEIKLKNFDNAEKVEYMQIIQKDESTTSGWAFTNGAGACFIEALGMQDSADAQQEVIWGLIKFQDPKVVLPTGVTAKQVTAANIDLALIKVAALTRFKALTDKTKIEVSEAGIYAIKAEEEGYTYKTATAYVGFGEPYPALSGTEVIAKKSSTSVDKTTEDADHVVAIGDIVTYKIEAYVPFIDAANAENRTFTITDEITGADYYLTGTDSVSSVKMEGTNDQVGSIVVDPKDATKFTVNLNSLVASKDNPNAGKKITVTYTAKVNALTVENKAGSHVANTEYGANNVPVKVFTGEITLTKYGDNKENNVLASAEFEVYKDNATTPLKFKQQENGNYRYAPDAKDATTTVITNGEGKIVVEGLDVGSYHFKETKAPTGYSINTDGKTIELTQTGVATAIIKNSDKLNDTKLNSLPSTGGMGTYLFTIIGVVVMAGAAGAFFISRRKGSEE